MAKSLPVGTREELLNRVLRQKIPVAQACRELGISRFTYYKWLKRYKSGKDLKDKPRKVERFWRQTTPQQEELVLKVVVENPTLSKYKIAERLREITGQPILGPHGVYNVLRRWSLTLPEARLAYVQRMAPAVQPVTWVPTAKAFLASLASSSILSLAFLFWLQMVSRHPFQTQLGLIFASISLSCGTFFFLYSMKYYFTLAVVLSFSRQPQEEGGGYALTFNGRLNNNQKNNNGWLARIFGLNGSLRGPTSLKSSTEVGPPQVPAGGLQPSLDHIKLERYPFISVHLPFYNEKKVAERILKACTSFDYPNYEVVVCDDSTDETTKITRMFADKFNAENADGPKVKVIHRETRKGFKGGALREALAASDPRAEFVIVFDADFIPYPDTLELFIKYFKVNNNGSEDYTKNNLAAVAGYQWHVLNKSENWITRGIRSEYAGSYVIERSGQEILGAMKLIHGSVYAIRADILKKFGWGTSITEDFELTLKLYEQGYKIVYTPYIQAPAECISTVKRLIRQRMRWAEGHSSNVKKMFLRLLISPKLTLTEKLEFIYLSPYYLQAFFFLIGTFSWLMAETVFRARLPFWTSVWGWSLVLTNFFSLPLVNAVGLFLEEAEEKDYLGLFSFIALSYLLVPFQAYASVKGFLEKEEGPWFRTPKTGLITDIFTRGRFYRWISGILPGRIAPAMRMSADRSRLALSPYLALATANNRFENFRIQPKRARWVGRIFLVVLLIFSITLLSLAPAAPYFIKPKETQARGFGTLLAENRPVPIKIDSSSQEKLEIIDVHSKPLPEGEWTVRFKTIGKDKLRIVPEDKQTVDDLDFIRILCDQEERKPLVEKNDSIYYANWECSGVASVVHRVNKANDHTLKFYFGEEIKYAYNATVQIDTSTSSSATAYSFQRKTWYDGTRLWSAFYSGTEIEFWYSADWGATWTQNTSATIAVSTNDFTIEADSADLFIVYTDGYDIKANEDTGTYPATNFAWGASPTIVYDGSSGTDEYDYPAITKDSNNKVWITATHYSQTTDTFYPDADPESTSVDGMARRGAANSTWVSIHDGAGTTVESSPTTVNVFIRGGTETDTWSFIARGFLLFDTSSLPDNATIDSATVEIVVASKTDGLGGSGALALVTSTPASNTNLVEADYAQLGTVRQATDLTIAGLDSGGVNYNTFTLNATGLGNIDKTGVTKFGLRIAKDADNVAPTWVSGGNSDVQPYNADNPGTNKDPKLAVTYTAYYQKAIQSTNANDISAWGTASTLDTSTNSNKYGTIALSGTGEVYAVWIDATTIEGKEYTSGTWAGSPTTIATGVTGLTNNMSAVSDSSGNVHLLYINSSDYAVYQEYTTSWQTAVTLDGTAGNDYPTISLNTSNNDLYALWIRSNVIYYKKGVSPYASANWDASATSWKATGTNTYTTSNYSGAGMIYAQWTEGSASPYSVMWDYIIIPEKLWLLLGLGLIVPRLLRRRKHGTKKNI